MKKNMIAELLVIVAIVGIFSTNAIIQQSALGSRFIDPTGDIRSEPKTPMAAPQDGNNVYVVWWTNRSGNWEVMFRASNDAGQTFGPAISWGTDGTITTTTTTTAGGNSTTTAATTS